MTRKALGRGLSALLREVETLPPAAAGLQQVRLERIDPNPFQPRRSFPEETLQELAASIRVSGLVQPVLLRRLPAKAGADERFQLVAGERRWRAAQIAGIEEIPAIVREFSDREALELALTENLLREDLNPIDQARGLTALVERFHLTHEEIAERLGLARASVTNTMRLLKLPAEIQQMVLDGTLMAGHARALAGVADPELQLDFARFAAKNGVPVRELELWIAAPDEKKMLRKASRGKKERKLDPNVRAAQVELERALGTRVHIFGTPKSGQIVIRYYSAEDLDRLFNWIARREN
jgi:ParB family chromosome partitioning protein